MMKQFYKIGCMVTMLAVSFVGWGQTNPTPHDLSSGNFSFTGFAEGTTTTYPTSMQGWSFSAEPTSATVGPATANATLLVSTTSATTGGIRNEISNGFGFLSSGSAFIGAIAVSLETTARRNIKVSWSAEDIVATATRVMGLKLQYRIGTSGNFTDISGTTYTSNGAAATAAEFFSDIELPSEANNQSEVQVRWLYYFVSGSGSRDRIRLDEISITSEADEDTTPPSFISGFPTITEVTGNGAKLNIQLDEPGTVYGVILKEENPNITAAQVKAGLDENDEPAESSGSVPIEEANVTISVNLDGLEGSTDYYVYLVAEDEAENLQDEPFFLGFTTDQTDSDAPVFLNGTPTISGLTDSQFSLTVRLDEIGTVFYVLLANDADAPSPNQVIDGLAADNSPAFKSGSISVVDGNTDYTVHVTGLTPGTSYDLYVIAQDIQTSPNVQADVLIFDVTTNAPRDMDSDIANDPDAIVNPQVIIASDVVSSETAVVAFAFQVTDLGTSDGLPTYITKMQFNPATGNTANWEQVLAGIFIKDSQENMLNGTVEISASGIELTLNNPYEIENGESELFRFHFWLKTTGITDGQIVQFEIPADGHGWTAANNGSEFAESVSGALSNPYTLDVVATTLQVVGPAAQLINEPFTVTVTARDANGNIDNLVRQIELSLETGTGILTGTFTKESTNGVATFDDVAFDAFDGIVLRAEDSENTISGLSGDISIVPLNNKVFFSEYIEGSSNNKALEIYNNANHPIDLSQYEVRLFFNGSSTAGQTINLSSAGSILSAKELVVIAHSSSNAGILAQADFTTTALSYNGDDAIGLYHLGTLVDVIGEIGVDPGTGWTVGATGNGTVDRTLVREFFVQQGNPAALESFSLANLEWDIYTTDYIANLGTHFECVQPTAQATDLQFSEIGDNNLTLSWTRGNGDNVIVIAKANSATEIGPSLGDEYEANAEFGEGSDLGSGHYVVYIGNGTSESISGLNSGTAYHFAVYEFNDYNLCYSDDPLTGSTSTTTSADTDSDIVAADEPVLTTVISSLVNEAEDAVTVFNFKLIDSGTNDGMPSLVTKMVIRPGANNTANWVNSIEGAHLSDGEGIIQDIPVTITSNTIEFDFSEAAYSIADGEDETFELSVWLKTAVVDNSILQFQVSVTHGFLTDTENGSSFKTELDNAVVGPQISIDVAATDFTIVAPASVFANADFSLTATAKDANGNVDVSERDVSVSVAIGSGILSSASGLANRAMTDGVFTWTDLRHNTVESIELNVTDGDISIDSDGIDVLSGLLLHENFEYGGDAGNLTTVSAGNWTAHSGAGSNPVLYATSSLDLSGYVPSASGGAATFVGGGGTREDINRAFTSITSGTVYASALINLSSASATPDYFIHFGPNTIGSIFRGRVFARTNSTGWSLSLSKSNEMAVADNTILEFNKTYFIVLAYTFNSETDDDLVSVYLFDQAPESESTTPLASIINVGGGTIDGIANIGSFAIRQGTTTPTGIIDRIRVANNWSDAVGGFVKCTPDNPATDLAFTDVANNSMTVNWTRGDGDKVLVIAREGGAVNAVPVQGTTYTANTVFEEGDEIGTGNFVVYNGTGTSVDLTGLTQGTTYHFAIYEFNEANHCYISTALTGSQATTSPNDSNTDILPFAIPYPAADISSLANSEEEGISVLGVVISDSGNDGLTTTVTTAVITPGANNTANWTTALGGAVLIHDNVPYPGTITGSQISFDLSDSPVIVANASMEDLTLKVWLSSNVTDGQVLQFQVPTAHGFVADVDGSTFKTTLDAAVVSAEFTIDVEATALTITVPTNAVINTDFTVTARAVDDNGNTDMAARNVTLSLATGTGTLSAASGLTSRAMTNGVLNWTDVRHSQAGDITLSVTDGTLQVNSPTITVQSSTLVFEENFSYGGVDNADITAVSTWVRHSDANSKGPAFSKDPLIYNDFDLTATGGSMRFTNGSGGNNDGDVNRSFSPALSTNGSYYVSFLVNIQSALATADYFFHLGPNPIGTTFRARVFGRSNSTGWSVSLSKSTETAVVNSTVLDFNKTYLFVVKYTLSTATTTDDLVSVYVFDGNVPTSASDSPIVSIVDVGAGTTDGVTSIGTVAVRQGSNTPTGKIDRIRVASSWADAIGTFEANTTFITLNTTAFDGTFGRVTTGQVSASSNYTLTGTGLTEDVTVTAPAGFKVSLNNTTFTQSVEIPHTGGAIAETTVYVRFEPTAAQVYSGNVFNVSTGATTKSVAVYGTGLSPLTIFFEDFEECPAPGFTTYSVASNRNWNCAANGRTNNAMVINGFGGDAASDDWLITPAINLSAVANAKLIFYSFNTFADAVYPPISVKVSTDYSGTGDPSAATWTDLSAVFSAENSSTWTSSGNVGLLSYAGSTVYIAFRYISTGTVANTSSEWRIDDILVEEIQPFYEVNSANFNGAFGSQGIGTFSSATSFTVDGYGLSGDVTVTPPAQFQVSLTSDFTTVGTNASPLVINVVNATVDNVTVYARFAPTSTGAASGNITVSTPDQSDVNLAVSGTGVGFFQVNSTGFNDDFGDQNVNTNSVASSFTVSGGGLTGNVVITPPAHFQVSTSSTFTTFGTNTAPLNITPVSGSVSQTIYVRFTPTSAGTKTGNVTVATTGYTTVNLAVFGLGVQTALGIGDDAKYNVYPNPVRSAFTLEGFEANAYSVRVYALNGALVMEAGKQASYDVSTLDAGMYLVMVTDNTGEVLMSRKMVKE
jgi:hypothetical protein